MSEPATTPRQGPSRSSGIAGAVLAIAGGLVWLLPIFTFVFIVPKFAEIFAKFAITGRLPLITQAILAVSSAFTRYWYLFAALWAAVIAGLVIASAVAGTRLPVSLSVAFGVISLVLVVVIETLLVLGLFAPMVTLIQDVGHT